MACIGALQAAGWQRAVPPPPPRRPACLLGEPKLLQCAAQGLDAQALGAKGSEGQVVMRDAGLPLVSDHALNHRIGRGGLACTALARLAHRWSPGGGEGEGAAAVLGCLHAAAAPSIPLGTAACLQSMPSVPSPAAHPGNAAGWCPLPRQQWVRAPAARRGRWRPTSCPWPAELTVRVRAGMRPSWMRIPAHLRAPPAAVLPGQGCQNPARASTQRYAHAGQAPGHASGGGLHGSCLRRTASHVTCRG